MVLNGDVTVQNNVLSKMNLGEISSMAEQFVLQYYTVMNKCPEYLYRFYSDESVLVYENQSVKGQADINNLFTKLNLQDSHVVILKVDALKGHGNSVMVQVCGEQSVSGEPFRRFMRSFTLFEREQNSFAVIGDIFRFQDRVYIHEKKQSHNVHETESHLAAVKPSAKTSTNGAHENKNSNRHKPSEAKVEKTFAKKTEAEVHPKAASPEAPENAVSRKPVADLNKHSQPAPNKQEHVESPNTAQNKVHNPNAVSPQPQQQPQVSEQQHQQQQQQQKSTPNVPLSWAQRASNNVNALSQQKPVQPAKPAVSTEQTAPPVGTKPAGNAQNRPMRGFNHSAVPSGSRTHNQPGGPIGNKESNVDWNDNTHGSGRGGFGGQRGSMRAGGGTRGLNRGTPRGASHRGAANTPIVQSTRQ